MNFLQPFTLIGKNYPLLISLVWRDIKSKYSGSYIGWIWDVITPLIMLGVYTFVFSVVFNARWGGQIGSKSLFALFLFAGLIQFNFFTESVNSSAVSIISNENYVKKVIFPLEILPLVSCCVSLFHFSLSLIVWLAGYFLIVGIPSFSFFLFPFIFLPFALLVVGLTWIASSLSVYIRDLPYILSLACTLLLFLSPIFYSINSVPEDFQWILKINPLTPYIEMGRDLLMEGKFPSIFSYLSCFLLGFFSFSIGFQIFNKIKGGFLDVL